MKRNQHLVQLSREHHLGLLFCWKLRQGEQKKIDAEILRRYVCHFWEHHLEAHFKVEDIALDGLLSRNNFMVRTMNDEHVQLKQLIEAILSGRKSKTDDFLLLADLLTQHIRFEEREFFPFLEQILNPAELELVGKRLPPQQKVTEDSFIPAFWEPNYQAQSIAKTALNTI